MKAALRERMKELFGAALEMEEPARSAYLEQICAEQSELGQAVTEILEGRGASKGFLSSESPSTSLGSVFCEGQLVAGRFRIMRFHGRGGMGEVYEAFDERLRLRLGLKTIRSELAADVEARERFQREVLMAREVSHHNLCRVFDLIEHRETDGTVTVCLTMEWLHGRTLQEVLRERRPLGLDETRDLLRQVAEALDALHAAQILHRDLKPGNIMLVDQSNGNKRAVVMDFGLSKPLVDNGDARGYESSADVQAGAPYFMAPELLKNQKLTAASDLYAFGLVLDECVTKSRAFDAGSLGAIYYQRIWEAPIPPSQRAEDLPSAWEHAILSCLEAEPELRPISAVEVMRSVAGEVTLRKSVSKKGWRSGHLMLLAGPLGFGILPVLVAGWFRSPAHLASLVRSALFVALITLFGVGIVSWQRLQQPAAPNLMRTRINRLTEASAFSNSMTVSQDGAFVVYSSDRDGGGLLNLWRQPLNGGTPSRLTSGKFSHEMPTLSPDGKILIFRIDQDGGTLARMSAGGGPVERIRNSEGGRDPRFSPKDSRILYWIPADEQTIDYGRVLLARLESISSIAPLKLFGDFAHAARPIWSDTASHVLALGTWQSNIPQKEFDAWVLEVQGIDSKGVPKKTGLFQALKQAGLSPPLSQRPWIEASEWRGGWLYLTVPVGEAMDLFRIRLRPETGVVEGPFERVTAGTGSGLVGGHRMAPNGDMVYARQESSADLFSVEVPSSGKVSGQLRKHTNDSGRINRLVIHASGTVGAWELRGNSAEEKPWFFDLVSGARRKLATGINAVCSHLLIAPDAKSVAFRVGQPGVQPIYLQSLSEEQSKLICTNCGMPSDWTSDGKHIIYVTGGKPANIGILNVATGEHGDRIEHPSYNLFGARARLDGDGNGWVVFYADNGVRTRQILMAPMRSFRSSPPEHWIPITDGAHWDQSPAWSADGKTIYYVNRHDGHASIMARNVDPVSGRPHLPSWTVHAFESARQTLTSSGLRRGSDSLWVGGGRIFFTIDTKRSDLWRINVLPK